jgi:hypothetical protein
MLDGWSGDEAFADGGAVTTFAWTEGRQAALCVALPPGLKRFRVRAFPAAEAVGPLKVRVGQGAVAILDLQPGWRWYEAEIAGIVEGGRTTIVLEPSGYRTPGPLDPERRALGVAVDAIAFDGTTVANRGAWPVSVAGEPALLVADAEVVVASTTGPDRLGVRIDDAVDASLVWRPANGSETPLARCPAAACRAEATIPAGPGLVVLRATHAVLRGVERGAGS